MKELKLIFAILLFFCSVLFAQEQNDSLSALKKNFESFNFKEVIKLSNDLLLQRDSLPINDVKEIYRMKAISHFSLNQSDSSKNSFIEILKIDSSFNLDSSKTSPKIISFFRDIKADYINIITKRPSEPKIKIDTVYIPQYIQNVESEIQLKNSLARSLILPGWGHFYQGYTAKGWIFTTLTIAALGSTIYYIIDTQKKEDKYLEQVTPDEIRSKYHDYNLSYYRRNISIICLAAVWLYSQIDLLFISNDDDSNINTVYIPKLEYNSLTGIQISYKLSF